MYIFTHIQNIFLSADMHLYKGVWLSYLFMNLSVRLCVCASIFPSLVPIWLICFGSINVLISTATAWPVLAYWLLFMNKLLPWKSLWVFFVLVFHHYGCMKLACPGRFFFQICWIWCDEDFWEGIPTVWIIIDFFWYSKPNNGWFDFGDADCVAKFDFF